MQGDWADFGKRWRMSYNAVVARIHTREHPNADRLQLGACLGYQVVVGTDVQDGELGVFFPTDGILEDEYCRANDLYPRFDEDGNRVGGGFFTEGKPRVRAQRFRGEKSDGYWTSVETLAYTGFDISKLREGDEFTELNGHKICDKYYTPATLKAMARGLKPRVNDYFIPHVETEQLKHHLNDIPLDAILHFTLKLHGTSGRTAHVLEERLETNWWRKILRKPKKIKEYTYLLGTRRTILRDHTQPGFYGNEEFRWNASAPFIGNLHKGETIYYEIVGYTTTGQAIMGSQDTSKMPEVKKQYGPTMRYKYGCVEGTCDTYVYRITKIGEDGHVVEYSWRDVQRRCRELGVKVVPEIAPSALRENHIDLLSYVESEVEGPDPIDASHIREGVVVRAESNFGTRFYKVKSHTFGVLEGFIKERDDYVDMEEVS